MTPRQLLIFLALCALPAARLRADWKLVDSRLEQTTAGVRHVQKDVSDGSQTVTLHLALFDTPRHTLRVIDAPAPIRLDDAIRAARCVAGTNGGYFHPDNTPLGLVVSDGKRIHAQERAKLLSGIVAATVDRVYVLRVGEFKFGPKTRNALQAGPFLIERGEPVRGLSMARPARRTAVLTDGQSHHALLVCGSVTLHQFARILAAPGVITEFRLTRALNLDGGSSTGFFFAGQPPFYLREFKQVRNFVGVTEQRTP